MSDHDAKKHRAAMRAKAHRLASGESGSVDSSDFKGEEGGQGYLHADTKMGMRPVSPRAYRRGGKVLGVGGQEARSHGGHVARKAGGGAGAAAISTALADLNIKDVNAKRPKGKDHVGGWAEGGRSGKAGGGPLGGWNTISSPQQAAGAASAATGEGLVSPSMMNFSNTGRSLIKRGGKVEHPHGKEDKKLAEKLVEHHTPRAHGGRVKKGTNIAIIIGSPHKDEQPGGAAGQPLAPPPARPMPPPQAAAPPPGGAPPMGGPPPGMPPGGGGAPPMPPMRASGGAVGDGKTVEPGKYPIKHASGGGKGRREKARAYGPPTLPGKSV